MAPFIRSSLTLALAAGWGVHALAPRGIETLQLGKLAGQQFAASDAAALRFAAETAFWSHCGLPAAATLGLLALLWWRPLRALLAQPVLIVAALVGAASLVASVGPAAAYYNKQDYAEPYLIMPNESAFRVPDTGDNQSSQPAFASADYLNKNKIASKRFLIPHARLSSSGFWSWSDCYVQTGHLYIVDRSPFNQEWVASATKGTSARDEGFQCQSSEGLDINVGLTISAFVKEENAARFLFHCGVRPPGGVAQRSVGDLHERALRPLADRRDAIERAQRRAGAGLSTARRAHPDRGQRPGQPDHERGEEGHHRLPQRQGHHARLQRWADTFTFDPKVQDALNRAFVAGQDRLIATTLAPHASTVQALAVAEAVRVRWNGAVPANLSLSLLPQGIGEALAQLVGLRRPTAAQP